MNHYPAFEGLTAAERDIVMRHFARKAMEKIMQAPPADRHHAVCASTVDAIIGASRQRAAVTYHRNGAQQ